VENLIWGDGIERFVRKFNPEAELEAAVAIMKGPHYEHGTAVFLTQGSRRCLRLDTTHGLTDEEAMWYTLMSWSDFGPRKKSPRQEPGILYYPPLFSHVFEKYWQHLENLEEHPGFSLESSFTQACMKRFSVALSELDCSDFAPLVSSEAKHSQVVTAEEAAISRLLPVQDGYDFWEMCRSSTVTGLGAPAPGWARTLF
jgi:hypothetical protein